MKKSFSIVAALFIVVAAQAQVYVGGSVGTSIQNASSGGKSYTNQNYSITPEVGYKVNSNLSVGLYTSLMYSVDGSPAGDDVTTWGLEPYVRLKFAHLNHVHFFVDGACSYEKATSDGGATADGFGFSIDPGILVDLTDRLQFIGRTSLFQYNSMDNGFATIKYTGFSLPTQLGVGVIYHF